MSDDGFNESVSVLKQTAFQLGQIRRSIAENQTFSPVTLIKYCPEIAIPASVVVSPLVLRQTAETRVAT